MTKSIDFYFDFISPYSYLAYKRIKFINEKDKLRINYKPILLGGLHKLGDITAPAFNERKMKNMKNDCELVALKNKIEFKWNSKFPINTLYLMRGYLVINDNLKEKFFEICFNAYWKDDIDISVEKNLDQILNLVKIDKKKIF
jgi:2-hydroxychromene-2-carboxylate isomerase